MHLKDDIKTLLEQREFDKLLELAARKKGVIRYLVSFLYSEDDLLHWRAVDALGALAKNPSVLSTEKAHTVISRLFLNLEDQSGGNAWGAIEAVGAMIAVRPNQLGNEIPKMFSFISDARLWKGLLWSVRRIGEQRPDLLRDKIFHVVGLLRNPSNTARGHAAWALGAIGDTDVRVLEGLIIDIKETLEGLLDDDSRVRIYREGELQETTVGDLAKEALASLNGRQSSTENIEASIDFCI
ncbi:MAG TPA: hypothetical protein VE439_10235 [Anaerolineae bacterium]|nr:hypothetical protein [Anaerolineae bacterium]